MYSCYLSLSPLFIFKISGQISAVMSVVEAIVPIVANPTYSIVYEHTFDMEYFSGAVFLVTLGCMIICILAFMYVFDDAVSIISYRNSISLYQF